MFDERQLMLSTDSVKSVRVVFFPAVRCCCCSYSASWFRFAAKKVL